MSPYCHICGEWMGPGKGRITTLPEPSASELEVVEEVSEPKPAELIELHEPLQSKPAPMKRRQPGRPRKE